MKHGSTSTIPSKTGTSDETVKGHEETMWDTDI